MCVNAWRSVFIWWMWWGMMNGCHEKTRREKKWHTQKKTPKHICQHLRFLCCCNVDGAPSTHSKETQKNCNTSMLLLVVHRGIPHNSLRTDLFLSSSVAAVCHGHSQSLHLNAHSKCIFIVTNHSPWMIVFALWLLILHHRYEQQIFKETWQWLHP